MGPVKRDINYVFFVTLVVNSEPPGKSLLPSNGVLVGRL